MLLAKMQPLAQVILRQLFARILELLWYRIGI
jgi:hypothetical protein